MHWMNSGEGAWLREQDRWGQTGASSSSPSPGHVPSGDEIVAARREVASEINSWFALAERLVEQNPASEASTRHHHFVDREHVVRKGILLGVHRHVVDGRFGRPTWRTEPALGNSIMSVSDLKKGVACPIHGFPCLAAEIERRKFRKTGVLFLGKAWDIHTSNGGSYGRDNTTVKILPTGVVTRGDDGACVSLERRQAVLNSAFARTNSVEILRRQIHASTARMNAYLAT